MPCGERWARPRSGLVRRYEGRGREGEVPLSGGAAHGGAGDGPTGGEEGSEKDPCSGEKFVVHLASQNTNLEPVVEGPAISLAAVHAKVRREGYRR